MKILITGGAGFLGRNLIPHLIKKKFQILILSKNIKNSKFFSNQKVIDTKIEKIKKSDLLKIRKFKPEILINLAWDGIPNFSFKKSFKNLNSQIIFFHTIMSLKSIKKIINIGSCLEYSNNIGKCSENEEINVQSFFIWAKSSILNFIKFNCKKNRIKYIWLRVFYMYGPFQRDKSLIPSIFKSLRNLKKPNLLSPSASNDFIHVDDVCNAILKAIKKKSANGIFNVGFGKLVNVVYIYRKILTVMNLKKIKQLNIDDKKIKNLNKNNFACLKKINRINRF